MRERPAAAVEDVAVLRLRPDDRLVVRLRPGFAPIDDPDEYDVLADGVARWAGIDRDRILLLDGADVEILRPDPA